MPDNSQRLTIWKYRAWLLWACDASLIMGAVMLGYLLRFKLHLAVAEQPAGFGDLGAMAYCKAAMFLLTIWTGLLWREGAYAAGFRGRGDPFIEARSICFCGFLAIGAVMAFSFAFRGEAFALSRQVMFLGAFTAILLLILARNLFRRIDQTMLARNLYFEQAVLVGSEKSATRHAVNLKSMDPGIKICGIITWDDCAQPETTDSGPPVLGRVSRIKEIHSRHNFDMIMLSSDDLPQSRGNEGSGDREAESVMQLINFCEAHGIKAFMTSNSFGILVSQQEIGTLGGIPMVRLQDASLHPLYALCKNIFDAAAALAILLVGAPLWALVAIAIKRTSPGPVLYSQMRVGLHGKPFRMYKFRSMIPGAHEQLRDMVDFDNMKEPVYNIREDPRVTPIGRLLRRSSLDEIPQLINVLKGEMSLVGPRPEVVELVERYTPIQARRLKAKPGITGFQQVMSRGEPSLARRIELDLYYLKNQGLLLDLLILARTLLVIIRGDGFEKINSTDQGHI